MKNIIIKILPLFVGIILYGYNSFAQGYDCGTEITLEMAQEIFALRKSREAASLKSMKKVTNVVVQPHIVTNSTGHFGLDKSKLSKVKSDLNEAFKDVGFQFTFCPPNYIKNTDYYLINEKVTLKEKQMASRYNYKNALNIYFLKDVPTSYTWLPGGNDWMIIKNAHTDNKSTVAHEMGHYFGLMHTHGAKNPARYERVKRENVLLDACLYNWDVWGDGFKDTHADLHPNLLPLRNPKDPDKGRKTLGDYVTGCKFDGVPITDDCGDSYTPDPENIMSYSKKSCRTVFSQDQIDEMVATRLNERSGLTSNCGSVISPNCSDNIVNGDEQGIDCGGSCPASCSPTSNLVDFNCETGCHNNLILVCSAVSAEEYNGTFVISNAQITNQENTTVTNVQIEYSIIDESGFEIVLDPLFQSSTIIDEIPPYTTVTAPAPIIYTPDGLNGSYEVRVKLIGTSHSCRSTEFLYLGTPPLSFSCFDGIQNQSETGIDCGGPCPAACSTCDDNIQNQGETGVDCGGPCAACPTCNDRIQNQGETGIDCGGPCSAVCLTCNDGIQNGNETNIDCGGSCPPCKPDLVVNCGNVSISGNTINISNVVVTNRGNSPAGISFINYYLSSDANITTSDYDLTADFIPALVAGATYIEDASVDLSSKNIPEGKYYFGIVADYTSIVAESNEINNTCYLNSELYVTDSGLCGSDNNTLLLLKFDDTLEGIDGETPLASSAVGYTNGKYSNALRSSSSLKYAANNNIDPKKGTVEAWIKPTWNGNDGKGHILMQYGEGGGLVIMKDGANNLRLILNLFSPSGYTEIDVSKNIADWKANQWKHVAFSWGNGKLQLYINGDLVSKQNYAYSLYPISDSNFNIGAGNGGLNWEGVIDHLRISNTKRSQNEIIDFMNGCVSSKIAHHSTIEIDNFPNPFDNQTTISYTLPEDSSVTLTVYDGMGKQVALLSEQETKQAGKHSIYFNGSNYPPGIYYYSLQAGDHIETKKMILIR